MMIVAQPGGSTTTTNNNNHKMSNQHRKSIKLKPKQWRHVSPAHFLDKQVHFVSSVASCFSLLICAVFVVVALSSLPKFVICQEERESNETMMTTTTTNTATISPTVSPTAAASINESVPNNLQSNLSKSKSTDEYRPSAWAISQLFANLTETIRPIAIPTITTTTEKTLSPVKDFVPNVTTTTEASKLDSIFTASESADNQLKFVVNQLIQGNDLSNQTQAQLDDHLLRTGRQTHDAFVRRLLSDAARNSNRYQHVGKGVGTTTERKNPNKVLVGARRRTRPSHPTTDTHSDLGLPPSIAHEYIDAVNPPKFNVPQGVPIEQDWRMRRKPATRFKVASVPRAKPANNDTRSITVSSSISVNGGNAYPVAKDTFFTIPQSPLMLDKSFSSSGMINATEFSLNNRKVVVKKLPAGTTTSSTPPSTTTTTTTSSTTTTSTMPTTSTTAGTPMAANKLNYYNNVQHDLSMLLKEEFDAKNVELNRNANGSAFLTTEPFVGNINEHSIHKLFSTGAVTSDDQLEQLVLNLTTNNKIMTPPYQLPVAPQQPPPPPPPAYVNLFNRLPNNTAIAIAANDHRKKADYQSVHQFDQSNAKMFPSFTSSSLPPTQQHTFVNSPGYHNFGSARPIRPNSIHSKNRLKYKVPTINQNNTITHAFAASPNYVPRSPQLRPNYSRPMLMSRPMATTMLTPTRMLDTSPFPVNTMFETNFQDSDLNSVESQIFNTTVTTIDSLLGPTTTSESINQTANDAAPPPATGRLTTEKLAFILIGSCSALAILALLFVAVSLRCRDMYQEYKTWKRAQKVALNWQPRHFGLEPIRRSFPYQLTESFLMRTPFNLPRYLRTSMAKEDEESPNEESPVAQGPPMFNMCQRMPVPSNYNMGNPTEKMLDTILGNTKVQELSTNNQACCHCMNCTSTWFYRNNKNGGWCCQRGYYQPPRRSKLPFGAGSSVNTFMPMGGGGGGGGAGGVGGAGGGNNDPRNVCNNEASDSFDFLNEHDLNPEMAEENDRQQAQINQQLMMMGQAAAAAAAVNGNMNQMEESIDNCPRNFFHYNNIVSNENAGGFADELPQPHPQTRRWGQVGGQMQWKVAAAHSPPGRKAKTKHQHARDAHVQVGAVQQHRSRLEANAAAVAAAAAAAAAATTTPVGRLLEPIDRFPFLSQLQQHQQQQQLHQQPQQPKVEPPRKSTRFHHHHHHPVATKFGLKHQN